MSGLIPVMLLLKVETVAAYLPIPLRKVVDLTTGSFSARLRRLIPQICDDTFVR